MLDKADAPRRWDTLERSYRARIARGAAFADGKTVRRDEIERFLEAVIEPGDRVCIEGNNQKHADFLAAALARTSVEAIHDLHIWPMSTTETALTAHLVMPAGQPGDGFLRDRAHELEHRFSIEHATVQVETGDPAHPCGLAPTHVI